MQDLLPALHSVPVVPGSQDAFQKDRGVSDLRKTEKRLPDVHVGPGVWPAHPGNNNTMEFHINKTVDYGKEVNSVWCRFEMPL